MGAGGAQRGCEDPGFGSQLPPGPLQGQEMPWGRRARRSEATPPREPQHRAEPPPGGVRCARRLQAARRGARASPAAAPLASVPGTPLCWAWRRPHCSRPTLASSQPVAVGGSKSVVPAEAADTERPPLEAGTVCRAGGPQPAPAAPHHTPARPRPPRTAAGSHTAAPGGHTGHHRTDVPAHRNPGASGWTPGARGLGPRAQEVGGTPLWGGTDGWGCQAGRR